MALLHEPAAHDDGVPDRAARDAIRAADGAVLVLPAELPGVPARADQLQCLRAAVCVDFAKFTNHSVAAVAALRSRPVGRTRLIRPQATSQNAARRQLQQL